MKKAIIIGLIAAFLLTVVIAVTAVTLSFKVVRQNTDKINLGIKNQLKTLVRIPDIIGPETRTFETTRYVWEMETPQREISKVIFTHDTLFDKSKENFTATLEMETTGDSTIFNKVLPAVISDNTSLTYTADKYRTSLGQNNEIGYLSAHAQSIEGKEDQISKITWVFPKDKFVSANEGLYQKLYQYPTPLLKTLYSLQALIIRAFSS